MIDICTVVYREEIPLIQHQAQSLIRYARTLGIRNIYVVINDEDDLAAEINPVWYQEFAPFVCVLPRTAWSAGWNQNGWLSQQLWKMLVASTSYNVWTLVLDAKTILVKDLTFDTLFDSQGRARVGYCPIQPVFEQSKKITEQLWNIEMQQQLGPAGVPFLFHNDTVRLMIADATVKTRESFPDWFQNQGRLTEFILYSGYVQMRYGSFDKLYSSEPNVFPVNVCHSEVASFDRKLAEMNNSQTSSVSIHSGAWKQLTEQQRRQYCEYLVSRNIFTAAFMR